jgi:hypothetical protein
MSIKRKTSIGAIIVISIMVLINVAIQVGIISNPFLSKEARFQLELEKVAIKENNKCPISIDEETILTEVKALPNKIIQYKYAIKNVSRFDIDTSEVKVFMYMEALKYFRNNKSGTKIFRDNNVTYSYVYTDANNLYLLSLLFKPGEY